MHTESLTGAAGDLWDVASTVSGVRDDFDGATSGVSGACGEGEAGPAFASLVSAWSIAFGGLSDALDSFERNTETAAVIYEHADRSVMPSTPPPPPPPKHHDAPFDPFGQHPPVVA